MELGPFLLILIRWIAITVVTSSAFQIDAHQSRYGRVAWPVVVQSSRQQDRNSEKGPGIIIDEIKDLSADGLTKEELVLRFKDVIGHFQQSEESMGPALESIRRNLLCTRLSNLHLNRCHVAASSIPKAGLGVFARRDMAAGELITLFPGDALLLWNNVVGDLRGGYGVMFGQHVKTEDRNTTRVSSNSARLYELKIAPSQSIVADARLLDDAAYLGHMINDGDCLMGRDNVSRTKYSRNTFHRHNAAIVNLEDGCHYMVEATKNIQQGEEIFVSYGEGYWLSRLQMEKYKPKTNTSSRKGFSR